MNKQITPAIVALVLILWASYMDYSGLNDNTKNSIPVIFTNEEDKHQRWVDYIHQYENIINKKNLDYDNVNTLDLGLKTSNKEDDVVSCPLASDEICKIKHLNKNSFIIYKPKKNSVVILVGSVATTTGGSEAKDLFKGYRDKDGNLKIKAETYDFW